MFCSLVDEYDELASALPVSPHFTATAGPRPTVERWHRVVRAMTLRKFLLASTDEMHIDRVLDSARRCLVEREADRLSMFVEETRRGFNEWITYVDAEGNHTSADQMITQVLYGGLLHGDYDKWESIQRSGWHAIEMAMWQFTTSGESVVRRLRDQLQNADGV